MHKYLKHILVAVLFLGMMGCSDDSTGPDPGEAPELPEIQREAIQPDLSFFEQNVGTKVGTASSETGDNNNYTEAQQFAMQYGGIYMMGQTYAGFLTGAQGVDPTFEDGKWVWTYTFTYEGQSVEMKITAEEVAAGWKWAMFWSYDDGQGNSFEDYKVIEGTTSKDGSEGNWSFNTLDPDTDQEVLAYEYDWTITSDTEKSLIAKIYDSGSLSMTANYDENAPEHKLTFSGTNADQENITIFWNTDTKTGYIEQGTTKKCWDSNFASVPCS
jgi:hypothetical protein